MHHTVPHRCNHVSINIKWKLIAGYIGIYTLNLEGWPEGLLILSQPGLHRETQPQQNTM